MTALLAILSALLAGGADFIGGHVSRRAPAAQVAATAQVLGLGLAVPLAVVFGFDTITTGDIGWAVASGLVVGVGLAGFYAAMARGLISVVAPIAAVTGATIPVVFGLLKGERPSALALLGIAVAVVAIALVSLGPQTGPMSRGIVALAIGAGALFGLFFVFLSLTDDASGLWPVVFSRAGSSAALVALALATTGVLVSTNSGIVRRAGTIAVLEVAAASTLLVALQRGPVSVASVLASLYPVTTTLLAASLLDERLGRVQLAGVTLALGAIVLVSLG